MSTLYMCIVYEYASDNQHERMGFETSLCRGRRRRRRRREERRKKKKKKEKKSRGREGGREKGMSKKKIRTVILEA